ANGAPQPGSGGSRRSRAPSRRSGSGSRPPPSARRRSATSRRSGRSWRGAPHSSRRGATGCWRSARRCASSRRTCSGERRVLEHWKASGRRDALAELERERVGLAPAAQALLKERERFGDAVIGPLSDFVRTSRRDAVLAEQLLGEWLHAVLVRDASAVETIRRWHEKTQPGPLVLLPSVPGPRLAADGHPLTDDLRVDGPAAAWVRALLAGNEVLDGGG